MKHKSEKKKSIFFTVVSILLAIVGIALVLYPTVANQINQAANGKVIEEYRQRVESTGVNEYKQILAAVQDYNAGLAEKTPYIADLTNEKRKLYESLLNVADNGIIGYIEVPKADVYLAIYHGTEESVLRTGVGHLEGSSLPVKGESVHTVLTGHSGLPSARLFTDIDQLELGDMFTLHILNENLTYQVEKKQCILPEELEDMQIESGQELCTLVTCTPYGVNTHRLAVTGRRIDAIDAPDTLPVENSPIAVAAASRWNRMFVLMPPVVLIFIIIAVTLIRRRLKQKRKKFEKNIDSNTNPKRKLT